MKPTDIARLKKSTDLVAVVQDRGVKLAKKGNDYVGMCPFHEEKEPSFHVTPSKNLFHCFGCGAAGSVIDFVMRKDGIPFRQAVDLLLTKTGVVHRVEPVQEAPAMSEERFQMLLARVLAIYEKNFVDLPEGRAYLEKRGITDAGLFTQSRVGYCNGRLLEILPKAGPVLDELKSLGILLADGRERFTGCVVFPVFDADGNLTTLYGRFTGAGDKRHYYLPGRHTGLWNAVACKTYSVLILVESVIDALSLRMAGLDNVVSIQGTEGLSEADLQLFKDYGVQKLSLLLDGDEPGKTAVQKLLPRLSSFSCQVFSLPGSHDPNSYLVEKGPAELAKIIAGSPEPKPETNGTMPNLIAGGFSLTLGLRRYEIRGLEKGPRKLKATIRVEHAGKIHVDTLDFYSARWRRQLVQDLARIFDELPETLEADIAKLISYCEGSEASNQSASPLKAVESMTLQQRAEAEAFGNRPDLFDAILADYEILGLIGERANKLLCYLACISRMMEKPLAVLILSSSGAGKTTLQDTALLFCPPENLVKLTSLSGKALFYKEQSSLKHKVLALEEGDGVEEATYALRNLISAGELVIESTIKDLVTGKLTTMENRVEGPTAVFFTTTNPETDPETKSRFIVTSVDESREQTAKIMASQRRRQTLAGLAEVLEMDRIIARHRNFQRLLKPLVVVNPYGDQLEYGDNRLQGRRDQPKYLSLIKAVAFLRQMQKQALPAPTAPGGATKYYIEVDLDDIRLANNLAGELLGHSLDELSRPGFDLLMQLEKMEQAGANGEAAKNQAEPGPNGTAKEKNGGRAPAFTRRAIREFTGWSNSRVHRYLAELLELEYVILENGRNGTLQTYRLLYDGQGKDGKRFMLGLKPVDQLRPPREA